jgi:hypothetical protein
MSCLQWADQTCHILSTKNRTKELIFFLIDGYLLSQEYKVEDPQLLCVASIFFILKLETDLSDKISDFLNFVTKDMGISISCIRNMEYSLLINVSNTFCLLSPFATILKDIQKIKSSSSDLQTSDIDFIYINYIHLYITQGIDSQTIDAVVDFLLSLSFVRPDHSVLEGIFKENLKALIEGAFSDYILSKSPGRVQPQLTKTGKKVKAN